MMLTFTFSGRGGGGTNLLRDDLNFYVLGGNFYSNTKMVINVCILCSILILCVQYEFRQIPHTYVKHWYGVFRKKVLRIRNDFTSDELTSNRVLSSENLKTHTW